MKTMGFRTIELLRRQLIAESDTLFEKTGDNVDLLLIKFRCFGVVVFDLESAQDHLAWMTTLKAGEFIEYTISGVTYAIKLACDVDLGNEGVYCEDEYNDGMAYVIEIRQKA